MTGTVTWAGLDVHARSIHAAVVDARTGELVRQRFGGEAEAMVAFSGAAAGAAARLLRGPTHRLRFGARLRRGRPLLRGDRALQDAARERRPHQERSQGRGAPRAPADSRLADLGARARSRARGRARPGAGARRPA